MLDELDNHDILKNVLTINIITVKLEIKKILKRGYYECGIKRDTQA